MHQSALSYSLTKPYPYRWFTWLVVLGGIAATALFSVINLAADGYEITTQYITYPNETENPDPPAWYQKKPWSLASKVRTSCQDQTFEMGSQFYTNNTRIKYEITSITINGGSEPVRATSFTYHYNYFQDCTLKSLSVEHYNAPSDGNSLPSYQVFSTISCTLLTSQGPILVDLGLSIESIGSTNSDADPLVPSIDNQTQSAFWWTSAFLSDSLAAGSLINVVYLEDVLPQLPYSTSKIDISLEEQSNDRHYESRVSVNGSIYGAFKSRNNLTASVPHDLLFEWGLAFGNDTVQSWNYPDDTRVQQLIIWMNSIAKLCYSYIMTDLGQSLGSNILAHEDGIVNYLNATRNTYWGWRYGQPFSLGTKVYEDKFGYFPFDDPAYKDPLKFYEWYGTGVPRINPSVINTQYLCQIPKRKPIGSLIITVIVADLVFLQALWTILNWVTKFFLECRDPEANDCPRCATMLPSIAKPGEENQTTPIEYTSSDQNNQVLAPVSQVIRRRPVANQDTSNSEDGGEATVSLLAGS